MMAFFNLPRRLSWVGAISVVLIGLTACAEEDRCTGDHCFDLCGEMGCAAFVPPCANAACDAFSDPILRLDGGGVCNEDDPCPGHDAHPDSDGGGVPNGSETCPGYDAHYTLRFDWPLPGQDARDWVIRNYLDYDPAEGEIRDHMGNTGEDAKTYDGHRGIDISIANFRVMDEGFPVFAAAPGVVERVVDGFPDRNTEFFEGCGEVNNFVDIRHASGHLSRYLHFRKNSITVRKGDQIGAGTRLGDVGSAGCSTWPHLHFEVHTCDGKLVDPFVNKLWNDPPPYDTPLGLMDVILSATHITNTAEARDPPPNVTAFAPDAPIGMALVLGGGGPGDRVAMRLDDPTGAPYAEGAVVFNRAYTRTIWWWNRTFGNTPGPWTLRWLLNDAPAREITLNVK